MKIKIKYPVNPVHPVKKQKLINFSKKIPRHKEPKKKSNINISPSQFL